MLDSQRVGTWKNIWFCAPLGKSDLVQSLTGSHTRVSGRFGGFGLVSFPCPIWRRFVIGGNRKKLNFSRTPIRRVRAILIDNSIVATHCSAHLQFPFPYRQSPSVARSRIGFGFSGDSQHKGSREG